MQPYSTIESLIVALHTHTISLSVSLSLGVFLRLCLSLSQASTAFARRHQQEDQELRQPWFNKSTQQWHLVPASLLPRSKQGRVGGGAGGGLRSSTLFAVAAARKRERDKWRDTKRDPDWAHGQEGVGAKATADASCGLPESAEGRVDGVRSAWEGEASGRISVVSMRPIAERLSQGESGSIVKRDAGYDTMSAAREGCVVVGSALGAVLDPREQKKRRSAQVSRPEKLCGSDVARADGGTVERLSDKAEGEEIGAGGGLGEVATRAESSVDNLCKTGGGEGDKDGDGMAHSSGGSRLKGLMDLEAMLESWDNPVVGAYGTGSSHRILR